MTTGSVALLTSWGFNNRLPQAGMAPSGTVTDQFNDDLVTGPAQNQVGSVPVSVLAQLRAIRGVEAVLVIHSNPLGIKIPAAKLGRPASFGSIPGGVVTCAQLAAFPDLGRCPAGAQAAVIPAGGFDLFPTRGVTWPAASISPQRLQSLGDRKSVV